MQVLKTIIMVLYVIISLALIAIVLLQSGKEAGLSGALTGNNDSYMSKNAQAKLDRKLAGATKWIAAVFLVLTLAVCMMQSV